MCDQCYKWKRMYEDEKDHHRYWHRVATVFAFIIGFTWTPIIIALAGILLNR